jgi:uncharacterized membrane protein YgcG
VLQLARTLYSEGSVLGFDSVRRDANYRIMIFVHREHLRSTIAVLYGSQRTILWNHIGGERPPKKRTLTTRIQTLREYTTSLQAKRARHRAEVRARRETTTLLTRLQQEGGVAVGAAPLPQAAEDPDAGAAAEIAAAALTAAVLEAALDDHEDDGGGGDGGGDGGGGDSDNDGNDGSSDNGSSSSKIGRAHV